MRALLLSLCCLCLPLRAEVVWSESFEQGADGWGLPDGAALVKSDHEGGGKCLHVPRPIKRGFAELNVPVETGRIYRATGLVKCRDAVGGKGAVIFLQFSDAERQHVNGGSFPIGLKGTHEWQPFVVDHTIPIPPNVKYVRVTVGIDGTGEAWFDDLKLGTIDDWVGPAAVAPTEGQQVDTSLPELKWESWQTLLKPLGDGRYRYELELSPAPDFSREVRRFRTAVSETSYRVEDPLTTGTWYWRVNLSRGDAAFPPSHTATFVVPPEALAWPPVAQPGWHWSDEPRPELAVTFKPARASVTKAVATIDGQPAAELKLAAGRVTFRPAADLDVGIHEVKVELHAAAEQHEPVTLTGIFCNRPPASKVTFRPDGLMLVDGRPTFPIGAYRDPSDREDTFDGLLEAGFDVTHSYRLDGQGIRQPAQSKAYLEAAHAAGLGVFLGLPRGMVRDRRTTELARYVAETMDTPGLLAWYQFDEPEIQDCTPEDLAATYRAISAVDPFHPKITLVCSIKSPVSERFRAYAAACDIFWEDPYPIPKRPLTMVEEKIQACVEAAGPGKPVWCVLQAFSWDAWRAHGALKLAEKNRRSEATIAAMKATGTIPVTRPNAAETRCMAHLAIAAGAQGLIWYWSPNYAVHIVEDAPEVWAGVKSTVAELRELMPWLVAEPTPGDRLTVPEPLRVWSRAANGERLVVLINPDDRQLTVPADQLPELLGETKPVSFAPYEVQVRRVTE